MKIRAMTRQEVVHYFSGGIVILVALSMFGLGIHETSFDDKPSTALATLALVSAMLLLIVGAGVLRGERIKGASFSVGKVKFSLDYFSQAIELAQSLKPRILDDDVRHSREDYAKDKHLPGEDAPRFSAMVPSVAADIMVRPSAYPMTPMYLLDNAYRILDWNEAFSLAFDRTMEGRKGRGVLEWTYFLDNYEEVLDHGMKVFGEAQRAAADRCRDHSLHQSALWQAGGGEARLPDPRRRWRVPRLAGDPGPQLRRRVAGPSVPTRSDQPARSRPDVVGIRHLIRQGSGQYRSV